MRRTARAATVAIITAALCAGCAVTDSPTPALRPSARASQSPGTPVSGASETAHPTLSASAPTPASSGAGPKLHQEQLQSDLDSWRAQMKFPGAIVGVWTPTDSWIGVTGDACPGAGPITRAHHVRIGSVTKTFTATAVLALADQKRLSLDDHLDKYLDRLPNSESTIRQTLSMASGIVDYTGVDSFDDELGRDPGRTWSTQELLDRIRPLGAAFPPGGGTNYSNSNYVILGAILEKVTGKTWSQAVSSLVLDPVGLHATEFPAGTAIAAPSACGVSNLGDDNRPIEDVTRRNPSALAAAGGLTSTVDDLHVWAEALATRNPVLRDQTQKERLDSVHGPGGTPTYGLGITIDRGWLGHTGEVPGYTTVLRYHPERRTTVVVIVTSNAYFEGARPASVVFDALLGDLE